MSAVSGENPVMCAATVSANHLMKPTRFSPSASATSVANHASVFQAALLEVMSSHVTTRKMSISEITRIAAVVASMMSPPNIHSSSAITTSIPSVISRPLKRPIVSSSLAAHAGTSAPSFTSGG